MRPDAIRSAEFAVFQWVKTGEMMTTRALSNDIKLHFAGVLLAHRPVVPHLQSSPPCHNKLHTTLHYSSSRVKHIQRGEEPVKPIKLASDRVAVAQCTCMWSIT